MSARHAHAYLILLAALTGSLLWASAATAAVVCNPDNGHCYAMNSDFGLPNGAWNSARFAATTVTYQGISGHLATVTSAAENQFISQNFPNINMFIGLVRSPTAETGWEWVTGEPFSFNNWAPGEPNNCCGGEGVGGFHARPEPLNANGYWWNDFAGFNANPFLIEFEHVAPTANAGPHQSIHTGQRVTLDGTQSFDDNTSTAELLFAWTLISKPIGSAAALEGANSASPSFVADVSGDYLASLIVTDGNGVSSTANTVSISSVNTAPSVLVTTEAAAVVGQLVSIFGTAVDPDGDSVSLAWTLQSPPGSTATLSTMAGLSTTFVPDVAGAYAATLTADDGLGGVASRPVLISVVTAATFAENETAATLNFVVGLSSTSITTTGNQTALENFLHQTIAALQANDFAEAQTKLQQAIDRSDGCVLRGVPDGDGPGRDWVTDCSAQSTIYDSLTAALAALS